MKAHLILLSLVCSGAWSKTIDFTNTTVNDSTPPPTYETGSGERTSTSRTKSPTSDKPVYQETASAEQSAPSQSTPQFSAPINSGPSADQLRQWNLAQDRESMRVRMNSFQGSHSNQQVNVSVYGRNSYLEPHVVHEYEDQYGVWEVVRGDSASLYDMMTSDPNVMWRDSAGNWYNYQPQVFISNSSTTNNYNSYYGSVRGNGSILSDNTAKQNTNTKKSKSDPIDALSNFNATMNVIDASIRNNTVNNQTKTDADTKPEFAKTPSNVTINNMISVSMEEAATGPMPVEYQFEAKPKERAEKATSSTSRAVASIETEVKPILKPKRQSRAPQNFIEASMVSLPKKIKHFWWAALIGLVTVLFFILFLIFFRSKNKSMPARFDATQVTSATRMHIGSPRRQKHE